MDEAKILRSLARAYWEAAMSPENARRMMLHRAVNDLKMVRPVVLIDEIPFHTLDFDGSLTLRCTDPVYRMAEDHLRKKLFQWKHFPADMILEPFFPVAKIVHSTGIGVSSNEDQVWFDDAHAGIAAHMYHDQLATPEDVEKLHEPVISYDRDATMELHDRLAEAFGDILPIRLTGSCGGIDVWDRLTVLRGVEAVLIDLIEEPEHMHNILQKLFAFEKSRLRQMEELGLFDLEAYALHCTAGLCSDLGRDYDGGNVLRSQVWGRGSAQMLSSVSKAMHEEFDIVYQREIMADFGLNYYGCCEPLDKKMDIVATLPNLRKVSITPWADVDVAAEAIGKKYVLANKPNPAAVSAVLDEDALRKEIGRTLDAVKRNGCSCDIVLKDISAANMASMTRWEEIVMEMVQNF